jgi:hypothetical protein
MPPGNAALLHHIGGRHVCEFDDFVFTRNLLTCNFNMEQIGI